MTGYTRAAADALTQAARTEHDFGGWLAHALAVAAARLGSSDALTNGRPGSWEASLVDQLVKGTVGYGDEYLPDPAQPAEPPATVPDDQRVTAAREYLDAIRPYKVSQRPHSVLVREAAELRRQLGQVLDVIGQGAALTADQREVLSRALADALEWRQPSGVCHDCDASSAGLCADHASDLDRTDAYLALARDLGIEVDR